MAINRHHAFVAVIKVITLSGAARGVRKSKGMRLGMQALCE